MSTRVATFEDRVRSWEAEYLWEPATPSYPADRREPEPDSPVRTPFQRDRDRIVHSKAFRRLKHKTQVFVAPEGDHYRTRLTHTLEACFISRTVARALALNEDLTEAIGLGHDLGHPPFGHIGEEVLDEALREHGRRFRHNEHSLRVVERLEGDGHGLNLTEQVRDGILRHTGPEKPATLEGRVVKVVDRVAYINHDIDDALRAGIISEDLEIADGALLPLESAFQPTYSTAANLWREPGDEERLADLYARSLRRFQHDAVLEDLADEYEEMQARFQERAEQSPGDPSVWADAHELAAIEDRRALCTESGSVRVSKGRSRGLDG